MVDENPFLIEGLSPWEYAAKWASDPTLQVSPRKPTDGQLFADFAEEAKRTPELCGKLIDAIERVRMHFWSAKPAGWENEIRSLSQLRDVAYKLIPKISLEQCEDRRLYRTDARNFNFGVYDAKCKGFIGIRTKFGGRFLDTEYHFDTGAPHGTVFPVYATQHVVPPEVSTSPTNNPELFKWIEARRD